MQEPSEQVITVSDASDVSAARRRVKAMSETLGFDEEEWTELMIVVSELGSNLMEHAGEGVLTLRPIREDARRGLQIESLDEGPGIRDVDMAMTDGFSTAGSLGYGLGTVNRLMDRLDITTQGGTAHGTHITCTRWLRPPSAPVASCPLAFGAATRAYPGQPVNGDAFVIKRWDHQALVAVIDGLGHGQHAHRASQAARTYVERHFDRSLIHLFRGTGHACRSTRGVVMAVAHFDWRQETLTFGSIGNIEARVLNSPEPVRLMIRRGILGGRAPDPKITEHPWDPAYTLILHSDGLRTHWNWEDFSHLDDEPATVTARELLFALGKDDDDATIIVVKGAKDA